MLEPVPEKSAAWNRGRTIVLGIGHCTECHTPRNSFGVLQGKRHLAGGVLPPKNEKVPAITSQALKKSGYDKGGLKFALQYGIAADGDVLGSSMAEVVRDQLEHLKPADLDAIAAFLLDE